MSPASVRVGRLLERLHLHWLIDARVSASLGHRRRDALRLWIFHVALAIAATLHLPPPRPLRVALAPEGHEVVIRDLGELAVLHSVWVEGEYEAAGDPAVIVDLGANVGFASLFFARRHPSSRIVAVEADPQTYQRLVRNVGSLPNVTPVNRAVAGSDGSVPWFSGELSISSSLNRRSGSPAGREVEVVANRLDTLMRELAIDRIDLLKMDVEGAEFDVLPTAPLDRVEAITAEIHYDLGEGSEATLRELLRDFELEFRPLPHPNRWILNARRPPGAPRSGRA